MITQKEIARTLDNAAARSAQPATQKQVWFLAGLMVKNGEDGSDFLLTSQALSKGLASELIEIQLKSASRQAA